MSEQNPQQPEPKKSWFARHKILTALGGVFALVLFFSITSGDGDGTADKTSDTVAAQDKQTDGKPPAEKAELKKELSQADQFKAFIGENGTDAEKAAAEHVIKVQGADESNGILDAAEVYTDFTGGMMGPHQGEGKLLASAFADWKDSKNGLVTIYDEAGEILSNGQY
ncbi:hypothetical protein OG909_11430 [Streptomyces sp. NBC_01754]|uniref:hypothetical protein n=1 Tax=Streptomyces sp. NBC_01754 TaxID=2975930 RepID=UPI002DD98715|nr:hypothetical protein [Streptomyces sp. NBC_01754]WSC92853.1 hypothetical protein OG909_11430 [Streptomyces sp. NBC_01754]